MTGVQRQDKISKSILETIPMNYSVCLVEEWEWEWGRNRGRE